MNIFLKSMIITSGVISGLGAMDPEPPRIQSLTVKTVETGSQNQYHPHQVYVNETAQEVAVRTYAQINKNWSYPSPGEKGSTQSTYWTSTSILIKDAQSCGVQNPIIIRTLALNCHPEKIVEALADLISKPACLDCTIAINTVSLLCMQYMMGEDEFRTYAKKFYDNLKRCEYLRNSEKFKKSCGVLKEYSTDNFFLDIAAEFISMRQGDPILGSMVYSTNLPSYATHKPRGHNKGENLVCMKNKKYLGFGELYKDGPITADQVKEAALDAFCDPRDVEFYHYDHKKLSEIALKDKSLFIAEIDSLNRQHYNFFQYFDYHKLAEYNTKFPS